MERVEFDKLLEADYRKNYKKYVKYLTAKGSGNNAEDAVQEGYTRALEFYQAYAGGDFSGWIWSIIRSQNGAMRRQDMRHGAADNLDDLDELPAPDTAKVNMLLMDFENAVKRFTQHPDTSTIINLHFLYGLKPGDVSELVPQSTRRVWNILSKFRQETKSSLAIYE